MCTAVAILLKERNKQMCGVQSYISSALFSTRIHKKVCVCVCVHVYVCVCVCGECHTYTTAYINDSINLFCTGLDKAESSECHSQLQCHPQASG